MNENYIYKLVKQKFHKKNKAFINGIGDDAAIWKFGKKQIAISCDSHIDGIHFSEKFMKPEEISYRAVSVALSDLAAMGASPLFYTNSLNLKKGFSSKKIKKIFDGFHQASKDYKIELVGGNIVTSKFFSLDITVVGEVKSNYIPRGSTSGETVYVSGNIGSANAGLRLLKRKEIIKDENYKELLNSYKRPKPKIGISKILSSTGLISSMIDITDGLYLDLKRLIKFKNNKLGATIDWNKIPKLHSLNLFFTPRMIPKIVLEGGDDFELLFTIKKGFDDKFQRISKLKKINVFPIGKTNNSGVIYIDIDGNKKKIKEGGYIHKL